MFLVSADDDVVLGHGGFSDGVDGVDEEVFADVKFVVRNSCVFLVLLGLLAEEVHDVAGSVGHLDDLLGCAARAAGGLSDCVR